MTFDTFTLLFLAILTAALVLAAAVAVARNNRRTP